MLKRLGVVAELGFHKARCSRIVLVTSATNRFVVHPSTSPAWLL
jgi:hypothetical protein